MDLATTTIRLQREVPNAEANIDQALASLGSLLQTMATGRASLDIRSASAHCAMLQVSKAITDLVSASGAITRAHSKLVEAQGEVMVGDVQKCPSVSSLIASVEQRA